MRGAETDGGTARPISKLWFIGDLGKGAGIIAEVSSRMPAFSLLIAETGQSATDPGPAIPLRPLSRHSSSAARRRQEGVRRSLKTRYAIDNHSHL